MASPSADDPSPTTTPEEDPDPDSTPEEHPVPSITSEDLAVLKLFPKNSTQKNTQWSLRLWNSWRAKENAKLEEVEKIPSFFSLLSLSHATIDHHLTDFISNLKRVNGEDFPFATLKAVIFGAQRYAKAYAQAQRKQSLLFIGNDYLFPEFNKAYTDTKCSLAQQSVNRKSEQKRPDGFGIDKERALWDMSIFGCHSAQALSDTMSFYLMKIYGLVSGLSLRLLRIEHFEFSEDEHGKYVELDKNYAKDVEPNETVFNRSHGIETAKTGKLRMYCDPNNPRSFYFLLQRYINEIKNTPTPDTSLLLTPKKGMKFSTMPIGRNNLAKNFNRIMNSASLKGYYTNLSFVQSIAHRLLAGGFNTKKQRCFKISDHLQICKILDPPVGFTTTEAFSSQTRAIYQLGTLQNVQQYVTLPLCCPSNGMPLVNENSIFVQGNQTNLTGLQNTMQLVQPSSNANILTYNKMFFQESSRSAVSQASQNLIPVPNSEYTNPRIKSDIAVSSQKSSVPATRNQTEQLRDMHEGLAETDASESTSHLQKEQVPVYPLFMTTACEQDSGEDVSDNILIKQEPVETENESGKNHNWETCQTDMKETNEDDNRQSQQTSRKSHLRKRKLNQDIAEETDIGKNAKTVHQDNADDALVSNEEHIGDVHNVDVEFSYSHDVEKKFVKQEVAVNDDAETVFSCTGSTKFGRTTSDLELSLGDYLPDDGYVKVSDIKLKRIVTEDGGKVVFQFKYSQGSKPSSC